jgi:hypothetical protein
LILQHHFYLRIVNIIWRDGITVSIFFFESGTPRLII